MPNPPPCKCFQIHLSTAIVMMFVAGALIWANTRGVHRVIETDAEGQVIQYSGSFGDRKNKFDIYSDKDNEYSNEVIIYYGWPFDGMMTLVEKTSSAGTGYSFKDNDYWF